MAKYRKKPVVIEAFKFTLSKNNPEPDWFLEEIGNRIIVESKWGNNKWYVDTLEGRMEISSGDYVIKGIQGEIYPCKPEIFHATYEEVQEDGG